jgi:two-component system response regulator DegU
MRSLRVVIADDHTLFREGLRRLLDGAADVAVVGEASTGRDAILLVARHAPDVVLMDINMPDLDGIAATEWIVRHHPKTHVVVLTMYADDQHAVAAVSAGAKGYLVKHTPSDEVVRAIRLAAAGGSPLSPSIERALLREFQRLLRHPADVGSTRLDGRDTQLIALLIRGLSNGEIARELGETESAIKGQLSTLYRKLGVRDRTQAVLHAIANGLVPPPGAAEHISPA